MTSHISVASPLMLRGQIDLALGKWAGSAQTLTESGRLHVDRSGGAHVRRWLAHALHGVAVAALSHAGKGDEELETAFQQMMAKGSIDSVGCAEIALQSGSAARRCSDFALALQHQQLVQAFQARSGWLDDVGQELATPQLVLDGLLPSASVEARTVAERNLEPTLAALRISSPNNPLAAALLAARPREH